MKLYLANGMNGSGYKRINYDTVYDEISGTCEALRNLVETARNATPMKSREAAEVIDRIREGDNSARSCLIEIYLRTALSTGLKWSKVFELNLQDAIDSAILALVEAANSYNPDEHGFFSNYMFRSMKKIEYQFEKQYVSKPESLEVYLDSIEHEEGLSGYRADAAEMAETEANRCKLRKTLNKSMRRLKPMEKKVLEYRFGIVGEREYTLGEISQMFGVTRQWIRVNELKGLRRVRCNRELSQFRCFRCD